MSPLEWLFWLCLAQVAYTYFGYPIILAVLSRVLGRDRQIGAPSFSVAFLLPVHNEEQNLARRLDELTRLIELARVSGEVIVITDGSTDRSAEIARSYADRGVRVLELLEKQGKAAALSAGAALAQSDLLIFADARQRWADDALTRLIENFADPTVGAVSGDLVLESAPGVLAGVGLYWRFEKWLRKQESRLGSQVGVTGAISAVRRSLFHPIPPGTLLDDVFWPMHVVLQGFRVVHDERALAFDRLPDNPRDEFRRKVRTLAGNFQMLTLVPMRAFLPIVNRVWCQWISHKLLRLAAPWALIGMLAGSLFLPWDEFALVFWGQVACYALGLLGVIPALGSRMRLLGAGASFLVLNAAAWLAFWVWISGRAGRSWHKVQYQAPTD
ncbi:MAG: glycosyltransferase family 2 protein [Planctomycetes bacterium]|nr:glycosyltransferase family 2 protein [Planctomycetota bacterium]